MAATPVPAGSRARAGPTSWGQRGLCGGARCSHLGACPQPGPRTVRPSASSAAVRVVAGTWRLFCGGAL